MASTHARALPRLRLTATVVDALVGTVAMLLVASLTALTPAFTDYEAEIEPTLRALMHGDLAGVAHTVPIYGGSLALEAPFSAVGWLVGGDFGMYRATLVPGALAMLALATLAASWMRAAGRPRLEQLGALLLIAASPAIAAAWSTGHGEELVVSAAAIGGILLIDAAGERRGRLLLGALLLGLACGGKLWPVALLPVGIAATRNLRDAVHVGIVATVVTAALVVPNLLVRLTFFQAMVSSVGGAGIFAKGNFWWFFGPRNPHWVAPTDGTVAFHQLDSAYRFAPSWLTRIEHPLVMLVAAGLAAGWWWRMRTASTPLEPAARTASLLLLVGAVVWWRAVLDGWFQPYYLTAAIAAFALADARRGRFPVLAALAWVALWILDGPNDLTGTWAPDLVSAAALAWTLPVGVWSSARALRSAG